MARILYNFPSPSQKSSRLSRKHLASFAWKNGSYKRIPGESFVIGHLTFEYVRFEYPCV